MTVWHLRDLCANKQKIIKCEDVKVIQIPMFEGLTTADILAFIQRHRNGETMNYLPIAFKEILKLPRSYIANVAHSVIGLDFKNWVNTVVNNRNARMTDDRDMAIRMDPEIARIFKNSTSVSCK